jgi:hypothetical protein
LHGAYASQNIRARTTADGDVLRFSACMRRSLMYMPLEITVSISCLNV